MRSARGGLCETDEDQDGICDAHECGTPLTFLGVTYETVQIENQCWFSKNLESVQFANGDSIALLSSDADWVLSNLDEISGYCYFGNDSSFFTSPSVLYNWYSVIDDRGLCPLGWHVPTNDEWNDLGSFFGGDAVAGIRLKSSPDDTPSWNGTNESGWTALPGGVRYPDGSFDT